MRTTSPFLALLLLLATPLVACGQLATQDFAFEGLFRQVANKKVPVERFYRFVDPALHFNSGYVVSIERAKGAVNVVFRCGVFRYDQLSGIYSIHWANQKNPKSGNTEKLRLKVIDYNRDRWVIETLERDGKPIFQRVNVRTKGIPQWVSDAIEIEAMKGMNNAQLESYIRQRNAALKAAGKILNN